MLQAIETLQQEGLEFEFKLIENVSNDQVIALLDSADIVVDEPSSWCARLSVESCASSCCVVGGNIPEYEAAPFESPIILFRKDSEYLTGVLRELITDKQYRQQKMRACFEFWEKYYSKEAFDEWFSDLYSGKAGKVMATQEWSQLTHQFAQKKWQKLMLKILG